MRVNESVSFGTRNLALSAHCPSSESTLASFQAGYDSADKLVVGDEDAEGNETDSIVSVDLPLTEDLLPIEVRESCEERVSFVVYRTSALFLSDEKSNSDTKEFIVATPVASAKVGTSSNTTLLENPVVLNFQTSTPVSENALL